MIKLILTIMEERNIVNEKLYAFRTISKFHKYSISLKKIWVSFIVTYTLFLTIPEDPMLSS